MHVRKCFGTRLPPEAVCRQFYMERVCYLACWGSGHAQQDLLHAVVRVCCLFPWAVSRCVLHDFHADRKT